MISLTFVANSNLLNSLKENLMEILSQQEVEQVSGAKITVSEAFGATLGLMALTASSPIVIAAGAVALIAYAWM